MHAQGLYGLVSRKTNLEPLQPQLLNSVAHRSVDVSGQYLGTSVLDPHFSCKPTTVLILSGHVYMIDKEEDNKEKERIKKEKKKFVVGKILRSTLPGHARTSPYPPHISLGYGDL